MTLEEAIKILNDTPVEISSGSKTTTREYNQMLHLAEKALEKQIPKKPKNSDRMVCPVCNSKANYGHPYTDYCCHCGQKTDWRETE